MTTKTTAIAATMLLAGALGLAACGTSADQDGAADQASTSPPMSETMPSSDGASPSMGATSPSMSETMPSGSGTNMPATSGSAGSAMNAQFGPECAKVPANGPGSFVGMATEPVATAASGNPLLATLVGAVKKAGLVDTLNSAQDITVFAPANDAFAKVDKATLTKTLGDKNALTNLLTYHVVPKRLSPEQVTGSHQTLAGQTLQVMGSKENLTVGKSNAKVLCGNVQTANATVYIIDGVLMP